MPEPVVFKYRAFLSYSHTDRGWAKWLHGKLEGFHIDKDLIGRQAATGHIPKSLRPIFLDREDFTAGHTLNEQTLAALNASASLIVLCSKSSAKSHYVNEELRLFKSQYPCRPVIPIIVDGSPGDPKEECFAPALKFKVGPQGQLSQEAEELLAADVREEADGRNLAIAKTVARLLDLQTDDVFRRAERERRRQTLVHRAIVSLIALLTATGFFLAWQSNQRQQTIAEVESIVAKYDVISAAEADAPNAKESLAQAITAIAEGAANDARYAKALELLKAGKPGEAEPLLKAVAEEKEARAARENKQAADAYKNLGAITRISDAKRAREAYAKALALGAHDFEVLYWNGRLQCDAGNLGEAEQAYSRLRELNNPKQEICVACYALAGLGDIARKRGKFDEALENFQQSLVAADHFAKAHPDNTESQLALGTAYDHLGDVLMAQGRATEALEYYRNSLANSDRMAKANPNAPREQRNLWVSYMKLGRALGNSAEALKTLQSGLAITGDLAASEPGNKEWQRELGMSYQLIGMVLQAQGNLSAALKRFGESLTINDALAKADPDNAEFQANLARSYELVGTILEVQGNLPAAVKYLQDSLAVSNRLTTTHPEPRWRHDVANLYDRLGDVQLKDKKLKEALESYQKSLEIHRQLAEADSTNSRWREYEASNLSSIGSAKLDSGDIAGALAAYEDMVAITRRLVGANQNNTDWQQALAVSLEGVGNVKRASGNLAAAIVAYKESLAIQRHVVEIDRNNAQAQIDLVRGTQRLAMVAAGDEKDAAIRESVKILDQLSAEGKLLISHEMLENDLLARRDRSKRGWLGLRVQNVPEELALSLKLESVSGAVVATVAPDGSALHDGLQVGDVIVAFNDNAVADARDLLALIARTTVGQLVTIKYIRNGTINSLQTTMGQWGRHLW